MFTTFAFWPRAFHLAPLNDLPARLAAQIPCFQNPQLTADFCALQHRPVEPRRCDMSGDDFHKTKQADQSLRRARSGHLPCVILRHGRADQERDTTARSLRTHRSSALCGAKAAQSRYLLITILTLPTSGWAVPFESWPHLVTPAGIQALQ